MHAGTEDGRGDAGGEIAVADKPDARAGVADVVDQFLVARAIEHDDDQILHVAVQRRGDLLADCLRPEHRGRTQPLQEGPTTILSM